MHKRFWSEWTDEST